MRDKIAGLRAQLAEIRAEKIKVQKQLRNERRQQARLKSKAKSLSTAALKQIVLERETEPSVAVQRKRAKVTKQKKTAEPSAAAAAPGEAVLDEAS
jgi:chromosome segregation ATPase